MGKALIYARHKSELALQSQIKICRDWCHENNHSIVRVRQEMGTMTALELAHYELEKEDLDFDLIVAATIDRYDRDPDRLIGLTDQAIKRGVGLFTAAGQELTSSTFRLASHLMVATSELEFQREQEELRALQARGMKRVVADVTDEELAALKGYVGKLTPDADSALGKLLDGVLDPAEEG